MARLNDAGMHRSDGHLVGFIPFDPIKIHHPHGRILISAPGIMARAIGLVKPEWLEPRMAFRAQAPLLGDLTFKPLNLRALRSQGGKRLAGHTRFDDMQQTVGIVGEDRPKLNFRGGLRSAKEGDHSPTVRDGIHHEAMKSNQITMWNLIEEGCLAVAKDHKQIQSYHRPVSRNTAASCRISLNGAGRHKPSIKTKPIRATIGAPLQKLSWKGAGPAVSGGLPRTRPTTVAPIPRKTTSSNKRYKLPVQYWPVLKAAVRIENSLTNGPKGGEPVIARKPAKNSPPERGNRRSAPHTFS